MLCVNYLCIKSRPPALPSAIPAVPVPTFSEHLILVAEQRSIRLCSQPHLQLLCMPQQL